VTVVTSNEVDGYTHPYLKLGKYRNIRFGLAFPGLNLPEIPPPMMTTAALQCWLFLTGVRGQEVAPMLTRVLPKELLEKLRVGVTGVSCSRDSLKMKA
jgi:hypothetical protein